MDGYRHQVNTHPDILRIFLLFLFPAELSTDYLFGLPASILISLQTTDINIYY